MSHEVIVRNGKNKKNINISTRNQPSFHGNEGKFQKVESQLNEIGKEKWSEAFTVATKMTQVKAREMINILKLRICCFILVLVSE